MSFCWEEYLRLAEDLLASRTDEAAVRAAISRAYYAVYCTTRDERDDHNALPNHLRLKHKLFWDSWRYDPDPRRRWIATVGDRLRKSRTSADYQHWKKLTPKTAHRDIANAEDLLTELRKIIWIEDRR